jgi:hypothetical protein
MIEAVLTSLGVRSGAFDCDLVGTPRGPLLLEMTPRVGGNSLSKLFKAAFNFDLTGYAVAHACGDPYVIPPPSPPRAAGVMILGAQQAGHLLWNDAEARALRREPWVQSLLIDLPHGAFVERFTNGRRRVGEALIVAGDRGELDRRVEEFKSRLDLRTEASVTTPSW